MLRLVGHPVYRYSWEWRGYTSDQISGDYLVAAGKTIQEIVSIAEVSARERTRVGLSEKAAEQGLTLSNIVVSSSGYFEEETREVIHPVYGPYTMRLYRVGVDVFADFESDRELMGSPIALELLLVIKWIITAIVAILVAYFIVEAIRRWLESMTTTKTIIRKYDQYGNIIEEETTIEPEWKGIATLGAVAVVAMLGVIGILRLGRRGR